MNTEIQNQEEYIENWYEAAEYMLTNENNQLSKEEIDQLLAEATYNMTDEEAENFFRSLGGIVSKGLKVVAPIAKSLAPIVGTVAGAAIGGPVGARIGGALGGAIGGAIPGGNRPQQAPASPVAQPHRVQQPNRPTVGQVLNPVQAGQINQPTVTPTPTVINQGSASHAPVTNQLLMLINNPEFLLRLLRAVIPNNSRQSITTRPSEEFIQDVNTIKLLSEEILNIAPADHLYEDIEEELEDQYYYDEYQEQCECSH